MKKIILFFISLIFLSSYAFSQELGGQQEERSQQEEKKGLSEYQQGMSASQGAQSSSGKNALAMGISVVYSGIKFKQCFSSTPPNWGACAEGALGLLQASEFGKKAGDYNTKAFDLAGTNGVTPFNPADYGMCPEGTEGCSPDAIDQQLDGFYEAFKTGASIEGPLDQKNAQIKDLILDLEKKGFKVDLDKGTYTTNDGKTGKLPNAKDMNISDKLKEAYKNKLAGLDEAIIGKAAGSLANSEGGKNGNGNNSSGSGFGANKRGLASLGGLSSSSSSLSGKNDDKKKEKSFLSSLSDSKVGSGGVGVAGDDIFKMLSRRYTKKTQKSEFLRE